MFLSTASNFDWWGGPECRKRSHSFLSFREINIGHNNFNMCVFMIFFLASCSYCLLWNDFETAKISRKSIRFFHFNHKSLCGKVWFMFMTGHDVAIAGEFEFDFWKDKKTTTLVILWTAVVDVLQMAKALLFMSEEENQPVKKLYLTWNGCPSLCFWI